LRRNYERVKWYYDDTKDISQGKTTDKMTDEEAAKKIMIGTIVGNY